MALFQRGVRHNRTPIMEEVMRHFRSRYSQADIERIRRERESDFRRWVIDYIGGQIHFIQHLRGAESVQVLGEIEAVDFNATHCIVRVANLRQRNRDRLESWRTLVADTSVEGGRARDQIRLSLGASMGSSWLRVRRHGFTPAARQLPSRASPQGRQRDIPGLKPRASSPAPCATYTGRATFYLETCSEAPSYLKHFGVRYWSAL
ncbi:MAG: hypothetical protein UY71_C0001G0018 [Parcubacteria group bacterium GW2011_GWB1_52_7]|nr:MAG: hypothetical protein UY71_C0001G0018 [Parcubacteria group bacterium GW2011_GWB1_52_7]